MINGFFCSVFRHGCFKISIENITEASVQKCKTLENVDQCIWKVGECIYKMRLVTKIALVFQLISSKVTLIFFYPVWITRVDCVMLEVISNHHVFKKTNETRRDSGFGQFHGKTLNVNLRLEINLGRCIL